MIAVGVALAAVSGLYTARHFAINTDVTNLISPDLPWRQRELAYEKAFPQSIESIIAVIHGPTPELTSAAASAVVEISFIPFAMSPARVQRRFAIDRLSSYCRPGVYRPGRRGARQ